MCRVVTSVLDYPLGNWTGLAELARETVAQQTRDLAVSNSKFPNDPNPHKVSVETQSDIGALAASQGAYITAMICLGITVANVLVMAFLPKLLLPRFQSRTQQVVSMLEQYSYSFLLLGPVIGFSLLWIARRLRAVDVAVVLVVCTLVSCLNFFVARIVESGS